MEPQDIKAAILEANQSYYADGESGLDDDTYDALAEYARGLGVDISTLTAVRGDWPIVKHRQDMDGIPTVARNEPEWTALRRTPGFYSPKLDGLTVELQYTDGRLEHAVLRGDGVEGEDVMLTAMNVPSVPTKLEFSVTTAVRGEVVVSFNNLRALNELCDELDVKRYASPRSAASMIRNRTRPAQWFRLLTFIPFGCDKDFAENQKRELDWIESLTPPYRSPRRFTAVPVTFGDPADAWKFRDELDASRSDWIYLLDGVVHRDMSGQLTKLKFPPRSLVTTVETVEESLGRTGVVTPVIVVKPVDFSGYIVTRVTMHNADMADGRMRGVGPGAVVIVSRRGDVIPHVEKVLTPSADPWRLSGVCPSCGAKVEMDGAIARCTADPMECPGTVAGLLLKWCREVGIEEFGPSVAAAAVTAGLCYSPADLYVMPEEALAALDMGGARVGARAAGIIESINAHSRMSLGDVLGSLGVRGCARSVMGAVARAFKNDLLAIRSATDEELSSVPGVGPERASAIRRFMDLRYEDVVRPLVDVLDVVEPRGPLEGLSFCITLGLRSGPRHEVEAKISAAGGIVKSSVSRDLSFLVCNSPDAGTTKLKRAHALGVPVIAEDFLLKMMGTAVEDDAPAPQEDF